MIRQDRFTKTVRRLAPSRWLILAALPLLSTAAACGGGSSPEQPLDRFVEAINDADFNDAYQEFSFRCRNELSLQEFQDSYGQFFLAAGVGSSGFAGGSTLKAEDVRVERIGDYEAQIILDWVLHSSFDNPLPFLGKLAEENVPLNTVLKVAGTADRPLYILDETRKGQWRLDDCDPLGLEELFD